jgi:hypothetical protein
MSNRNYTPRALRGIERAQEPYSDPIASAMAHRDPAPAAQRYFIDPRALEGIGAGDRALEEARQRMLDPLGLAPGSPKAAAAPKAAPAAPRVGDIVDPTRSALEIAYATSRAMAQRSAAAAQQKAAAPSNLGVIHPTVDEKARAQYQRRQAAGEGE